MKPKVVIARVHAGLVDARFWASYETLQRPEGTLPAVIERLHVDRARNEIVDMVLHPETPRPPSHPNGLDKAYADATHILFIDDDMIMPPNGLVRLLSHNVPIVGALYFARTPPHLPIAYRHVEDNQWVAITNYNAGLQEVDAIGAGFLLVKTEVFKKIQRPWFEFSDKMGEDMYFCLQAGKAGYTILLDGDVVCRHLSVMEVGPEHFQHFKNQGLHFQEHEKDLRLLSEEIRPYRPKHLEALVHGQ